MNNKKPEIISGFFDHKSKQLKYLLTFKQLALPS